MEATCNSCNHWESNAPQVKEENFGTCEVLTDSSMKYVLPVIQNQSAPSAGIITKADFGCNQYEA